MTACGSAPVSNAEAADVPTSRIFDASLLSARPGAVAVVIKRDAGFVGGACNAKVFVNGSAIADLATSEKVVVYLAPGQHMLGARHNCMGTLAELQVRMDQPGARTFRIGTGPNGDFSLQPTAF